MVADADGKKAPPLMALAAGGIAGGVEAACTYPFEFAKTRVQLYGHEGVRNPFYVVAKVAREEGLRALYKGCSTMVVVRIRFLSCFEKQKVSDTFAAFSTFLLFSVLSTLSVCSYLFVKSNGFPRLPLLPRKVPRW